MTARDPKAHRFGGPWTEKKLRILKAYLQRYTTALKNQPFTLGYIDAFAGTGSREDPVEAMGDGEEHLLIPELADEEPAAFRSGSARNALETDPPFDRYVFIEKRRDRCDQLEGLKATFPELASRIRVLPGEANAEIRKMCNDKRRWSRHRAVLFLDPYGMQVEWKTIEAIAAMQAIDLWVLFPLMGANRMITKSGEIDPAWRRRLDRVFGTPEWESELYRTRAAPTLFDRSAEVREKVSLEEVGRFFNERLKAIFAGVSPSPGILRNSLNTPLFLFCFASGNPRGAPIALNIANSLLKELR